MTAALPHVAVSATPAAIRFGDAVRVAVVARDAQIEPLLGPWQIVRERRGEGRWSATLVCLSPACLPPRTPVPRVVVTVGGVRLERRIPIAVASRVGPSGRLREQTAPPPWRYRVPPGPISVALYALAAALAASVLPLVRRRRARADSRSALERALAAVREARGRPAEDRRKAVGALALELRRLGRTDAGRSDRLAWSAAEPEPAALAELADDVERSLDEVRR